MVSAQSNTKYGPSELTADPHTYYHGIVTSSKHSRFCTRSWRRVGRMGTQQPAVRRFSLALFSLREGLISGEPLPPLSCERSGPILNYNGRNNGIAVDI